MRLQMLPAKRLPSQPDGSAAFNLLHNLGQCTNPPRVVPLADTKRLFLSPPIRLSKSAEELPGKECLVLPQSIRVDIY